nr:glycosyltransferase [Bacillus sp. LL01]
MFSTPIIVNFPTTGAGYTNVKVGIFEAAATGRLIMTEYFAEMENFFEYDKEIVGYKDKGDLMKKLDYYIENPDEAKRIALAGQKKCLENHTWKMRLHFLFQSIKVKIPKLNWKDIKN